MTLSYAQAHSAQSGEIEGVSIGFEPPWLELVAPLDHFGHIDPPLWQRHRNQCRVRRFWQGEDDQIGPLVYKREGAEHARWLFGYRTETWMDDQSGYRFGAHNLRLANTSRSMTTPANCTPFK
jgi:hypothetical protein